MKHWKKNDFVSWKVHKIWGPSMGVLSSRVILLLVSHEVVAFCSYIPHIKNICDPTQANEALWGRYQNWHFKFNILFYI